MDEVLSYHLLCMSICLYVFWVVCFSFLVLYLKVSHGRGGFLPFPLKDHFLQPSLHFRAGRISTISSKLSGNS